MWERVCVCVTVPASDYHICIRRCCFVTGQCHDDDDDDGKGCDIGVTAVVRVWLCVCVSVRWKAYNLICRQTRTRPGLTCDICCKRHFTVQQGLIRIELHPQSGTRSLWLQTLRMNANFGCVCAFVCVCVCVWVFMTQLPRSKTLTNILLSHFMILWVPGYESLSGEKLAKPTPHTPKPTHT